MFAPQTFPQVPQLLRSVWVVVQAPLQNACPDGQAEQVPPLQSGEPDGQTLPHVPQFMASVIVAAQVPLQFVFPSAGHGS
jgi:hypothetical protein